MDWIRYERPRWASSWLDLLSPRPLWLDCPAGEAIQRELKGKYASMFRFRLRESGLTIIELELELELPCVLNT